jgi:hypothetical protein
LMWPVTAGSHQTSASDPLREVEGRPDGRPPPVSDREKKKKGKGELGRRIARWAARAGAELEARARERRPVACGFACWGEKKKGEGGLAGLE